MAGGTELPGNRIRLARCRLLAGCTSVEQRHEQLKIRKIAQSAERFNRGQPDRIVGRALEEFENCGTRRIVTANGKSADQTDLCLRRQLG